MVCGLKKLYAGILKKLYASETALASKHSPQPCESRTATGILDRVGQISLVSRFQQSLSVTTASGVLPACGATLPSLRIAVQAKRSPGHLRPPCPVGRDSSKPTTASSSARASHFRPDCRAPRSGSRRASRQPRVRLRHRCPPRARSLRRSNMPRSRTPRCPAADPSPFPGAGARRRPWRDSRPRPSLPLVLSCSLGPRSTPSSLEADGSRVRQSRQERLMKLQPKVALTPSVLAHWEKWPRLEGRSRTGG